MGDILGVGTRLRELRCEARLTQERLAEAADVAWETVRSIEQGKRAPSLSMLGTLASAIGVPPAMLIDGAAPHGRENWTMTTPLPAETAAPGPLPARFTIELTPGQVTMAGPEPMTPGHAQAIIAALTEHFGAQPGQPS